MKTVEAYEPRWHAALAVLAALALYTTLPPKLIVGPLWLLPLLVLITLVPLLLVPSQQRHQVKWVRWLAVANIGSLGAFNIATIALLLIQQATPHHKEFSGEQLLLAAVQIWLTNILVYALWYWEIDGGGPVARMREHLEENPQRGDFLFSQSLLDPSLRAKIHWHPNFIDYLFLAFNTATAFSPTDTFPLTPRAKTLMMAEALTALVTIAIVAGRAVNMLGS